MSNGIPGYGLRPLRVQNLLVESILAQQLVVELVPQEPVPEPQRALESPQVVLELPVFVGLVLVLAPRQVVVELVGARE